MTDQEKQIEEMRKEVASIHRFFLEDEDYEILDYYIADKLFEKGYRKEIPGEWIEHIEKPDWLEDDVEVYYNCSVCGTSHWSSAPPYCPNCGAKMKGAE